jgi:hypothetical protein
MCVKNQQNTKITINKSNKTKWSNTAQFSVYQEPTKYK